MGLDPCLVALAPEAEGGDDAGGDELDGEDRVDLADELVADVGCRFGHGAAKLSMRVSPCMLRWRGATQARKGGLP